MAAPDATQQIDLAFDFRFEIVAELCFTAAVIARWEVALLEWQVAQSFREGMGGWAVIQLCAGT